MTPQAMDVLIRDRLRFDNLASVPSYSRKELRELGVYMDAVEDTAEPANKSSYGGILLANTAAKVA